MAEGDESGGGGGGTLIEESEGTSDTNDTLLNEPVSPVKADMTFVENWRDMLPDDLKDEKCLESVTDFPNAIKQLVNHKKMVGKNKIPLPSENASEEEWAAFNDAIRGDVKVADDYKIEVPEELSEIYNEESLKDAKELAFKLGASQRQFEAFMKRDMERAAALIEQQEKAEIDAKNKAYEETRNELKKELGIAYEERLHVANRFVTELVPDSKERERLMQKFGNDIDFIRMTIRAGERMTESKALVAELTNKTPNEAMARIKELQNTPGYTSLDGSMTDDQKQQITQEIRELYQQVNFARQAT